MIENGVLHTAEPVYPADSELNPMGRLRADWRLDDGTYVEFFGLLDRPSCAAKTTIKRTLAVRHGVRLVELTPASLPDLLAS